MSYHNDPYRVDYLKIYPCLKERPDVLEVLKKSDRKMKYMEVDLKSEQRRKNAENGAESYVPSKEDSLERLVYSAKCQFADDAEGVEDVVIRKDDLCRLHAALDQLSEEESSLIHALFFDEHSERELEEMMGVHNALATGVVDGGCANWEYICQQKFYSEAPYILESNHFFQCGVPSFNLDFWNSLSDEDKQMFTDTCAQVAAEQRKDVEDKDSEYKATVIADGATVTPMSEFADTEEVYKRYSDGLWKDIVKAADADDLYQIMLQATGRA